MNSIDKAISELGKLQELMLFDPMNGETCTVEQLSEENRNLYEAAGTALWVLHTHPEKTCLEPLNPDYVEILILHKMLNEVKIPHELFRRRDGWELYYPCKGNGWQNYEPYDPNGTVLNALEHNDSYGGDKDTIEIMGLLTPEESADDSALTGLVVGWLSADNVFNRIILHWAANGGQSK